MRGGDRVPVLPGVSALFLPRVRARHWPPVDRALVKRRASQELSTEFPAASRLSRLRRLGHGDLASHRRAPVPSAGGLQALELYLVALEPSWLPAGVYHYDRAGHHLSQVKSTCLREEWQANIPSWSRIAGGALVWIIVGDAPCVKQKYGLRAERFLLLEAGHLMQNLCLLSTSLGLVTVPQGACFERWIARVLSLPKTDLVLYVAVAG